MDYNLRCATGSFPLELPGVHHGLQVCDAIFSIFSSLSLQEKLNNSLTVDILEFQSSKKSDTRDGILYADVEEFEKQRLNSRNGGEKSFGLENICQGSFKIKVLKQKFSMTYSQNNADT